jgi:hypothetical protein
MTENQLDAETDEKIAQVCYEANNAYRAACTNEGFFGGSTGMPWKALQHLHPDEADDVRQSVSQARQGATPEQLHESWRQAKLDAGWQYSAYDQPALKIHSYLVPYPDLLEYKRRKIIMFAAIVGALS